MGHLNDLAKQIYDNGTNKGFHPNGAPPVSELVANLHGEVSELWEAYRKHNLLNPCDKSVALNCAEEELADITIRCLDTCYALGVNIDRAIALKHEYNTTRPFRHGNKAA